MVKCNNCNKELSRSNKGGLCQLCRSTNRANIPASQLAVVNDGPFTNLTEEQLKKLPELPNNWIDEPVHNLTGGHLLKIITQANNVLLSKISLLDEQVESLKCDITLNSEQCKKHEETIKTNTDKIESQNQEINTLKKVILNQQIFMEESQRRNRANNLMITGIPTGDILYGNNRISENNGKVKAILEVINVSLEEDCYRMNVFNSSPDRPTYSVKLIFDKIDTKMMVLREARKLKNCECEALQKVFVKNDETKLARNENYRLREKARSLRRENHDSMIKIEKGKLLQDGVIVDKFDLNNQIFC